MNHSNGTTKGKQENHGVDFYGNARMYEALEKYGDRIDTIGLFLLRYELQVKLLRVVSPSAVCSLHQPLSSHQMATTIANDGANSIFRALRDNTNGASGTVSIRAYSHYWKSIRGDGIDIDLEKAMTIPLMLSQPPCFKTFTTPSKPMIQAN